MKRVKTWILVADGARARIIECLGTGKGIQIADTNRIEEPHPPSHELGRDRPARVHDSVGPGRHAVEPKVDPHRQMEAEFADHLANVLSQRLAAGDYDSLLIIAAPETLGDLRKALDEPVRAKVAAEIAKDLTHAANIDVVRQLQAENLL
jgi:protein required for attachment to host cells